MQKTRKEKQYFQHKNKKRERDRERERETKQTKGRGVGDGSGATSNGGFCPPRLDRLEISNQGERLCPGVRPWPPSISPCGVGSRLPSRLFPTTNAILTITFLCPPAMASCQNVRSPSLTVSSAKMKISLAKMKISVWKLVVEFVRAPWGYQRPEHEHPPPLFPSQPRACRRSVRRPWRARGRCRRLRSAASTRLGNCQRGHHIRWGALDKE